MKAASLWRGFALALILAAGAPTPSPAKEHKGLETATDRWINVGEVALIAARDGDGYLTASCWYGDPIIALVSTAERPGSSTVHTLAIGFDGAVPVRQGWVARAYAAPRWAFETLPRSADFKAFYDALPQHRELEAIVEDGGKEVLDVHFSLTGAAEALGRTFWYCPPDVSHGTAANAQEWGTLGTETGSSRSFGILRPTGDKAFQIVCDLDRRNVEILFWPKQSPSDRIARSRLALQFEGDPIAPQRWRAASSGFELSQNDLGFYDIIQAFLVHQQVTVLIYPPGEVEVEQETFPLHGVWEDARVFDDCRD